MPKDFIGSSRPFDIGACKSKVENVVHFGFCVDIESLPRLVIIWQYCYSGYNKIRPKHGNQFSDRGHYIDLHPPPAQGGASPGLTSWTIRLIRANQEFDTGNICVENWLTICNNLLMDHQQHYWYIKNSSRAVQNTNNSIYVLNTAADWLTAVAASYWSAVRGGGRGGAGGARAVITAGVCWGCKVNVTLWETSAGRPQHCPSRNIHNNSISREMRRKAALPHRAQLKKLQFDEYWLETNMTKLRRWVTAEARAPQEISQSEKQFVISQTRSKRSNCINTLEPSTKFRESFPPTISFTHKYPNFTVIKHQFSNCLLDCERASKLSIVLWNFVDSSNQ